MWDNDQGLSHNYCVVSYRIKIQCYQTTITLNVNYAILYIVDSSEFFLLGNRGNGFESVESCSHVLWVLCKAMNGMWRSTLSNIWEKMFGICSLNDICGCMAGIRLWTWHWTHLRLYIMLSVQNIWVCLCVCECGQVCLGGVLLDTLDEYFWMKELSVQKYKCGTRTAWGGECRWESPIQDKLCLAYDS